MRREKRWRYYCDFCKFSSGSKISTEIHERHCTANPNRICRMCVAQRRFRTFGKQLPTSELITIILKAEAPTGEGKIWDQYKNAADLAMAELRERTHNCPACILTAIRQSYVSSYYIHFDFKLEAAGFWKRLRYGNPGAHVEYRIVHGVDSEGQSFEQWRGELCLK